MDLDRFLGIPSQLTTIYAQLFRTRIYIYARVPEAVDASFVSVAVPLVDIPIEASYDTALATAELTLWSIADSDTFRNQGRQCRTFHLSKHVYVSTEKLLMERNKYYVRVLRGCALKQPGEQRI